MRSVQPGVNIQIICAETKNIFAHFFGQERIQSVFFCVFPVISDANRQQSHNMCDIIGILIIFTDGYLRRRILDRCYLY